MRIKSWLAVTTALIGLAGFSVMAETAAPKPALQLVAHNLRDDRGKEVDGALKIQSLDVAVDLAGRMAQTTLTVTFANPTPDRLEGDFTLDLPVGASVTAYGLDINGVMTDGVLERRLKAKEAYEDNIREGIDPGLGEVTAENQFRTHVFPILPGSGRTVRIVYTTPLGVDGRFVVPLHAADVAGKLRVNVAYHGMSATPVVALGVLKPVSAAEGVSFAAEDQALDGDLVIGGLAPASPVTVTRHSNGERFFELIVAAEPAGAVKAKTVRLYWDASRSRREQDIAGEAQLVADYVAQTAPKSLDLVVFADGAPVVTHFDSPTGKAVKGALLNVRYHGATRYAGLAKVLPGRSDVCLVVSDGQMTIDSFTAGRWPCRVLTVSSAPAARRDILSQLAAHNAGAYVDLGVVGHDEALRQLMVRAPKVEDLTDGDGASVDYRISPLGSDQYRIIGPAPRDGALSLDYSGESHDYALADVGVAQQDGAGVAWGAALIDALNATDAPDADKILATARRYHVATPDVSFIVLETGKDYAEAGIEPPATVSKAVRADYVAARDSLAMAADEARRERLGQVTKMWEAQKVWWATPGLSLAEARKQLRREPERKRSGNGDGAPVPMFAEAPPPPPPPVMAPVMAESTPQISGGYVAPANNGGDQDQEMVLVTGTRRPVSDANRQRNDAQSPAPMEVTTAEWNPDQPYLKALSGVKAGDKAAFDDVFAAQEKDNGDNPGFYFDVAEWMFRNGFGDGAAAMARNGLDLTSSNIDSQIILAGRLVRYGEGDDAIWLYRHIAALTPEKPQAKRNLALALIVVTDARMKAGSVRRDAAVESYEEALGLLTQVVLTPWEADYDGVEIIALMEANHLVAKLKAMDVADDALSEILPAKLTALLDVDIRITLEWNTDATDMDLWVDEPSGERAIYSNPKTLLGGRLSNDMTQGYGPEEYLLRVAPKGEYQVLANVFAADRIDRNGATSVTVHLYRDWGRPTEKEESFVIELKKDDDGAVKVGSFSRK